MNEKRNCSNPEAGFSLVELAVGVALLGIVTLASVNVFTSSSRSISLLQEQLHKNLVYDKLQYYAANLDAVKAAQAFNPSLKSCLDQLAASAVIAGGQMLCGGAMRANSGVGLDFRNAAGGRLAGLPSAPLLFTPQGEMCRTVNAKCTVRAISTFRLLCEGGVQNCARPSTLRVSYEVRDRPVKTKSTQNVAEKVMTGYADHRLRDLVSLADYGCEKREGFSEISADGSFQCNASLHAVENLKGSKPPGSYTGVSKNKWTVVDSFDITVDPKQSLVLMLTVAALCPVISGLNPSNIQGLEHVAETNPRFCGVKKTYPKRDKSGNLVPNVLSGADVNCGTDSTDGSPLFCRRVTFQQLTETYRQWTCGLSGDFEIWRNNKILRTGTYQTCDTVTLNLTDSPKQGVHRYMLRAKAHSVPEKSKNVLSWPQRPEIPFVSDIVHPLTPMNASVVKIPEP